MGLQISIYFERIYNLIFFFFEIILYIFKANVLVYHPKVLASEIIGLFFILILQYVKLRNANTANKTEWMPYHIYTILYSFPVIGGYIFYIYFQLYVLYFDSILSAIGILFALAELIFSIYAICKIS